VIKVKSKNKKYFKEQEAAYILDVLDRFIIGDVGRIRFPERVDQEQ
jgi:hypothetical protein